MMIGFGNQFFVNLIIIVFVGFFCGYFLRWFLNLGLIVLALGYLGYISLTESWEGLAGLVLIGFYLMAASFMVGHGVGYFFRNFKIRVSANKS